MRIVHVTDAYQPHLGGIEVHVSDLAQRQAACGHEVHVVTTTPGPRGGAQPQVHRIGGGWLRVVTLGSEPAIRLIDALRPDVVHCHSSVLSPLAVFVAAGMSAAGRPTAVTVHSLLPPLGPLLPLSGVLLSMRGAPIAWSAVSEVAAAPIRKLLGGRTPVSVLPNAVDIDWWRGAPDTSRDPGEVRLVCVGRLSPRKRPLPLLAMVAAAAAQLPASVGWRLVLVGEGPQSAAVARRADALGIGQRVDLVGRVDRTAIRALLASCDVYVAPARLESFGIAALEARTVGLPVVAARGGGVGGFVRHGREGLLAGSDREMASALVRLLSNPLPREEIRRHNTAVPPRFGWDDALLRVAALYERARATATAVPWTPGGRALADEALTDAQVHR
jgi:glycosyltransferase involved in cell wall biosynthesis